MPICVYCLGEKPRSKFTLEHVFPAAFGTFANNLMKLRCVCQACNQLFGDSIELAFGRDSFEAYLRFRYQVKEPRKVAELGSTRVVFSYAGPGEWRGVLLRLVLEGSGLVVDLVPQVAFKNKASGEWKHFSEADIDRGSLDCSTLDLRSVKLFAPNGDAESRLFKKLADCGITFPKRKRLDSPGILPGGIGAVDIHSKIDRGVRRSVAKITFNYLAFAVGPEFALGSDFDEVRRFILQGDSPGSSIVDVSDRPVLANDWAEVRQTNGHLVALCWAGSNLVCQVSLFNHLTYTVTLARAFKGIWRMVRCGHLFDFESRRIVPLVGVSTLLVPFRLSPAPLGRQR